MALSICLFLTFLYASACLQTLPVTAYGVQHGDSYKVASVSSESPAPIQKSAFSLWKKAFSWYWSKDSQTTRITTAQTTTTTKSPVTTEKTKTTTQDAQVPHDEHEATYNRPVSGRGEITPANETESLEMPGETSGSRLSRVIRPTKPPGFVPLTDSPKMYRVVGTKKPHVAREFKRKEKRKQLTGSVKGGEESEANDRVTDTLHCKKCSTTESGIKKLRVGMFVETMAKKLRMDVPDLMAGQSSGERKPPKLPKSVIDQMMRDTSRLQMEKEEDYYAKREETMLRGKDMGRDCIDKQSTGCYHFDLRDAVKGEVASVRLWWFKTRDRHDISGQTFLIYELDRNRQDNLQARNMIYRKPTHVKEGWLSVDITRVVRKWVAKGRSEEKLAITCKTCSRRNYKSIFGLKGGYLPILAIKYSTTRKSRRDRSVEDDCNPVSECCKRPLLIRFHDLNINHIVAPETLDIGYCFGYCEHVDQHTFNHTQLTQRVRGINYTQWNTQLKPCCVPTNLLDTYIITNDDTNYDRTLLPKVKVDTCGCL